MITTQGNFVSVSHQHQHSFTVDAPSTQLLKFYLPAGFKQLLIGIARPAEHIYPPPSYVVLPPELRVEKITEDYGQYRYTSHPLQEASEPLQHEDEPTPGATLFPCILNLTRSSSYSYQGDIESVLGTGE